MRIFSIIYSLAVLGLGLDTLILKGDSKLIQTLGLHDEKQKVKLAYFLGTLCFLAACTYPYQELIGWPPLFFGYDWVSRKTQSTILTVIILAIIVIIQKVLKRRNTENKSRN